jgi:hypothetical protein
MLQLLAIVNAVINAGLGTALLLTRGAVYGRVGLPVPLPFHAQILAVFLIAIGVGFVPAVMDPKRQRPYLWIFGVGVRLAGGGLFLRVWLLGVTGWLVGALAAGDLVLAVLMILALLKR